MFPSGWCVWEAVRRTERKDELKSWWHSWEAKLKISFMPWVNSAASQLLQYYTEISSFWRKLAKSQAQSRLRKKGFCRTCYFHFCLQWKMWQHSLVLSIAKHPWQQTHLYDLLQMQRNMMHVLKWEPCSPWVPVAALLFAWERNWAAWQCSPFQQTRWQMHWPWCKL